MDNLQDNAPLQCNEEWFDMILPFGKEFVLPNISSPLNPPWTDNSSNLFISQCPLLDTPPALDNAFALDMNDPSSAGNQRASFPVIEMVPSFSTSIPVVDQQVHVFGSTSNSSLESYSSAPIDNHQIQVPRYAFPLDFEFNCTFPTRNQPVQVPSFANISQNGSDVNLLPRNQWSPVVSSTNSPCFSLVGSIPLQNQPTDDRSFVTSSRLNSNIYFPWRSQPVDISTPPITSLFCYNDSNASNYAHNPPSGCTSFGGSSSSSGSLSVRNLQIRSSSFANSPLILSNGCLNMRNQPDVIPATTKAPRISSNELHLQNCSDFLQNTRHITRTEPNVSIPMRNQVGKTIHTSQSNRSGSLRNQLASIPSPLPVGRISCVNPGEYKTCCVCGNKFPTFHALGGHMSSHSKARKREEKMTYKPSVSHTNSPILLPELRDGSEPNMSTITNLVSNEKIEGHNSPNGPKERLFIPSAEDIAAKDFYSLEDIVKQGSSMLCKRSREEKFPSK